MRSLSGRVIFVIDFPLSIVQIYPAIPFWPTEFILKDQLVNVWSFPCMFFVVFPLLLLIFFFLFVCLVFVSLISMCLGLILLGFVLYGTLCTSWTWLTISFSMLGKFSIIISSKIFSYPFFFSSSSQTPIIWMLVHLILSKALWYHPQFCSFFLLYSALQKLFPPSYLLAHWFVLLLQIFCYWFLLEKF